MSKTRYNELINDSIFWDITNWAKAILYWEQHFENPGNNKHALELGCGENGGLSLWLASKGYNVICSGYDGISKTTKLIHQKHSLDQRISYETINALSIPFENEFDVICFKSILGGIVRDKDLEIASQVISQIQKALKPGGKLLFAENLSSSIFHKFLRNKFGALKNNWRYFNISEIKNLFNDFSSYEYKTFGFSGCFGRNETQRHILGKSDTLFFEKLLPQNLLYIISGIAEK